METENNIPIPVKKRRAKRKKAQHNPAEGLIKALTFISLAQKKVGTIEDQYCFIGNNWAVASNGKIMLATKIAEDLQACPHTFQFINALSNCNVGMLISQLSKYELEVNSEDFRGIVPCVDASELKLIAPNAFICGLSSSIKTAISLLNPILNESATLDCYSHLLLQNQTAVASNGTIIVEVYHGEYLDNNAYVVNKQTTSVLSKTDKLLSGYGYSEVSITFFFEDKSILTCVLPDEKYPEYESIFKNDCQIRPVPENFFKAVKIINEFSNDGFVYFNNGSITNAADIGKESSYKIQGLPDGMSFNVKSLLLIETYVTSFEFDVEANKLYFFGEGLRGVILGANRPEEIKLGENIVPF